MTTLALGAIVQFYFKTGSPVYGNMTKSALGATVQFCFKTGSSAFGDTKYTDFFSTISV